MVYCFCCDHLSGTRSCLFFKFPSNYEELKTWKLAIRHLNELTPSENCFICSCHFSKNALQSNRVNIEILNQKVEELEQLGRIKVIPKALLDHSYSIFESSLVSVFKQNISNISSMQNDSDDSNEEDQLLADCLEDFAMDFQHFDFNEF